MTELGKIERPTAASFREKRKLYCVPNIYPLAEAPDEYRDLVNRFWEDVDKQLTRLEAAGKITKIFAEGLLAGGEEALEALAKLNDKALSIVRKRTDEGAQITPIDIIEIFGPFLDWRNCLHVVRTAEVSAKILGFYSEMFDKRIAHITATIAEALSSGEAGLLIMSDEDRVKLQFPADIEVFLVAPPSLNDILAWVQRRFRDAAAGDHKH